MTVLNASALNDLLPIRERSRCGIFIMLLVSLVALSGCETTGVGSAGSADLYDGVLQSAEQAEARGQHTTAVIQFQKLLDRKPGDAAAVLGLTRNLRYAGEAGEAVSVIMASDGLKSERPAFLLEAAKAQIAAGAPAAALEHLTKARFVDGANWDVHNTAGIAHDMMDAYDEAKMAYARALELAPGNPAVINNMAISAALSGDLDRGIQILEEASLTVRRDMQIRQNLALFYGLRGDDDKARSISQLGLEEEDIRNNLSVYSRLRSQSRHTNR